MTKSHQRNTYIYSFGSAGAFLSGFYWRFSKLIIRPAEQKDIQEIEQLAHSTFHLACPLDADESEIDIFCREHLNKTAFLNYIQMPEHHLWIGTIDGSITGYCFWNRLYLKRNSFILNSYIYPFSLGTLRHNSFMRK